jgi:hypothetical protein
MKGRFPRTPAEFEDHGRIVVPRCAAGHTTWINPPNLVQRLGPDFDLYDGLAALRELSCSTCDAPIDGVAFQNLRQRAFGPVSFEEATVAALELRAFAQARDANLPDGLKAISPIGGGRRRRFGPRA